MKKIVALINLIKILFSKKLKLVFYSESSFYQCYYIEVLKKISSKVNDQIIYLTSDFKEHVKLPNVKTLYIGNGYAMYFIFLILRARLVIMTTTDLNNNVIKISRSVDNYAYMFHAINSAHRAFTKNAFDNYNYIFCVGSYHNQELRSIEKENSSRIKNLLESGYPYFEYLQNKIDNSQKANAILVAPSWNYDSENFFEKDSLNLIKKLLKMGRKVILRPHPEHFKRNSILIDAFINLEKNFSNFYLDVSKDNISSMNAAKFLITDFSGIAPEFLFTYFRPVIYFDKYPKIHNKNFKNLNLIPFEDKVKNNFGIILNSIEEIGDKIFDIENNYLIKEEGIKKFAKDNIYNFKFSADIYCEQIIKIIN